MCLFGLRLFVCEVVAMSLVVWGVMKFGGVVVVGFFSGRRVCGRGGKKCLRVLGCVVAGVVITVGGVIVVECGLLSGG